MEPRKIARELRPNFIYDMLKEGAKLMLPFLAGLGIRQWVHQYATALMWTAAFCVAAIVAFADRFINKVKRKAPPPLDNDEEPPFPMPTAKAIELWNAAQNKLHAVVNKTFDRQEIVIDGRSFSGCTFSHSTLVYNGTAPAYLTECKFDPFTTSNVRTGHPAIGEWMKLMYVLGLLSPTGHLQLQTPEGTRIIGRPRAPATAASHAESEPTPSEFRTINALRGKFTGMPWQEKLVLYIIYDNPPQIHHLDLVQKLQHLGFGKSVLEIVNPAIGHSNFVKMDAASNIERHPAHIKIVEELLTEWKKYAI
jgi:hypothetical protein